MLNGEKGAGTSAGVFALIGWSLALAVASWPLVARGGLFDEKPSPSSPPARGPAPSTPPATPPTETPPPVAPQPAEKPRAAKPADQVTAQGTSPAPTKQSPPDEATRRKKFQEIKTLLGDRLAKAKTPAEKTQLSDELLSMAQGTSESSARFMLLLRAERLGIDGNDANAALRAHLALAGSFDLAATQDIVDFYQQLAPATFGAPESQNLARAALADADAYMLAGRCESARQLVRPMAAWAHKANDHALSDRVSAFATQLTACEAEQRQVSAAISSLARNPNDPAANTAVGTFHCFYQSDWAGGLPMLAKGSDATLKKLASDELASPADPVTQLALADAWWNLADSSPPAARPQIHLRASKWYGAAAPSLTGLTKLKAEQRGEAYASQTASTAPVTIAAAKPAQAGPAAPTDPTAADAPTGEQPLTSIAQILGSLDPKLFPSTIAGWSLERQAAVNDALAHGPTGRAADLTFVVENINRFSAGSLYLTSRQITVGKFMARVNATLDSKKYDVYRTVREGQTITAKGKVGICRFDGTVLYVTLYQCQP